MSATPELLERLKTLEEVSCKLGALDPDDHAGLEPVLRQRALVIADLATALNALSGSQVSSAFSFLGSATTGLGSLASQFTQLSDPIQGLIKIEQDQFDRTYQALGKHVDIMTQRVNAMQASLSHKLQGADALLANLQSQQQILTASIQGLTFTSFGAAPSATGQTPIG